MTRHDPALSPADELRANVAVPFERAHAMPKSVYTSPDFAQQWFPEPFFEQIDLPAQVLRG